MKKQMWMCMILVVGMLIVQGCGTDSPEEATGPTDSNGAGTTMVNPMATYGEPNQTFIGR